MTQNAEKFRLKDRMLKNMLTNNLNNLFNESLTVNYTDTTRKNNGKQDRFRQYGDR